MKMILNVGLKMSTKCINLFAKWLLGNGLLGHDERTLFNYLEDKS